MGATLCLALAAFPGAPALGQAPATLRIATVDPECTIDPSAPKGFNVVSYGFGELLVRPLPDGGVEPWLLESFEQPSPTTWLFTLREGIRFHNGNPVDAQAVVASLQHRSASLFGGNAVAEGELAVTGPLAFTLTTPTPTAVVPNILASAYDYAIYDAAAVEAAEDEQALVEAGIYTGPYQPVSVGLQRIQARRFDGYWAGEPALSGVEVLCIPDGLARVAAVRAGEADIALVPPSDTIESIEGSSDAFYVRPPLADTALILQFDLTRPPFDDVRVRRALALAIDYEALTEQAASGRFDPAGGLYPAEFPWALATQETDQDLAARLLDEAGWEPRPDGIRTKDGAPLRVNYLWSLNAEQDAEPLGVVLDAQLAPVGFDVRITQVENAYDSTSFPPDWNAYTVARNPVGLGNNPVEFVGEHFGSRGGLNFGGIENPALDGLIEELAAAPDQARRESLLREIQEVVADQRYALVLGFYGIDAVVSPAYRTFESNSQTIFVTPTLAPQA